MVRQAKRCEIGGIIPPMTQWEMGASIPSFP